MYSLTLEALDFVKFGVSFGFLILKVVSMVLLTRQGAIFREDQDGGAELSKGDQGDLVLETSLDYLQRANRGFVGWK